MQQLGRMDTTRKPLARIFPILINVARTEVLPPRPMGPIPAALTASVIFRSISFCTSYRPSFMASRESEDASQAVRPRPKDSVQGWHPNAATWGMAHLIISSTTWSTECMWKIG